MLQGRPFRNELRRSIGNGAFSYLCLSFWIQYPAHRMSNVTIRRQQLEPIAISTIVPCVEQRGWSVWVARCWTKQSDGYAQVRCCWWNLSVEVYTIFVLRIYLKCNWIYNCLIQRKFRVFQMKRYINRNVNDVILLTKTEKPSIYFNRSKNNTLTPAR